MAVLLGEDGGLGEHGVGHALVVFPGVGQTPLGEKRGVHITPDAVGVDEGAVHVKNQHKYSPLSSIQKRHGKSTASCA